MSATPPCTRCASTGPALLPVRYAVVTDNIRSGIPGWAIPATPFPTADGYDYAVRVLRQGFVYVYYESNGQWDGWSVCEDGSLWKQPSAAYAQPKKTPDCTSPEHSATNVEMMVLGDAALSGDVWIAFSPSKWSLTTLDRYTKDQTLREKRMQCLEAWQWSIPANELGITAASPGSIENILDYQPAGPGNPLSLLPWNPTIRRISQTEPEAPWYTFDKNEVKPQGTIYPWSRSRTGNTRRTCEALQSRGQGKNRYGKDITPLVMALNDPIGITHELAGFGDDFAGLHKAWMEDLSIEFAADSWLNGVKNQLRELNRAQALHSVDYNMDIISAMTQGHSSEENLTQLREKALIKAIQSGNTEFAHDWGKYNDRLNQPKRDAFHQCHASFCDELAARLETLAALRVEWLQDPLFIVCSQDFYSVQTEDNLRYQEAVDYALASLNLTQSGADFLDRLIDQYSAGDERNLVWRSVMLNNPEVIEDTRSFLQGMAQHKDESQKADQFAYIALATKLESKFVKAYAKANDVMATQPVPSSPWSRAMLATDRRLTTLGDRFFNYTRLNKSLDTMNELLSKVLFTTSAGIATVGEEIERGVAQLVSADAFRKQLLDNLKRSESGIEGKSAKSIYNAYKERFDDLAKTAEGKTALKKSRIKLLIFAFNVLEYTHLHEKVKQEPENSLVRITLTATFLSTVSVASDVMMPAVEQGLKNVALTNSIKWIGSLAGTAASALVLGVDIAVGSQEAWGKKRWQFITLSLGKVGADFGVSVKALGGLLELAAKGSTGLADFAKRGFAKGVIAFAAWQPVVFLASWQAMIALFVIEQLIIYFSDNELQKWCEASVFGATPEGTLISTDKLELAAARNSALKKQEDSFNKAVKVIQ